MVRFLTVDMDEGFSLKARCAADDQSKRARDFLEATNYVEGDPIWGKGIAEIIAEAGTILDEQEIPLTGRALFVPGYGVIKQEEDPESVKLLEEDDQEYEELIIFDPDLHQVKYDPSERVVELMDENDQINKSFLFLIRSARYHSAFYILSKLRELNRELLAIINIKEGD
jgi:hypothetical protein